jgi:hypothetical protein
VCKHLFIIEVIDDKPPATGEASNPTISIHNLIGIEPRFDRTMKVVVTINKVQLTALLDSSLTHNFVHMTTATRAGLQLAARDNLYVAVTNGDRINSSRCCHNLPISIGREVFVIDCYGIALGSYDMVLGVQWLESLSPILWDFGRRTMSFIQDGHRVL